MYGNHCHFSKGSHLFHIFCILSIKQGVCALCSFWSYHYIIQFCCCGNYFTPEFSLNHVLDEKYQITHILGSLPREYSSVVEQVKIDRRAGSTLITMDEIKKRLNECYLQLKREHGWSEDEMTLNMKSTNNQNRNIKKGNKGKFFKARCIH